jgi:DNA-binding NarL/FixJ family response regulator
MQRFLLLEDDEIQRYIIQSYFRRFSTIEPVIIEPEQLSEYLMLPGRSNIIVMDWYISETNNGASIVEQIRQIAPNTVIVVYTASIDASDREAAMNTGVDGFLIKNGNIGELLNFLKGHINL